MHAGRFSIWVLINKCQRCSGTCLLDKVDIQLCWLICVNKFGARYGARHLYIITRYQRANHVNPLPQSYGQASLMTQHTHDGCGRFVSHWKAGSGDSRKCRRRKKHQWLEVSCGVPRERAFSISTLQQFAIGLTFVPLMLLENASVKLIHMIPCQRAYPKGRRQPTTIIKSS